jgi:4-hydroxybenzoate polyprenyltransferase
MTGKILILAKALRPAQWTKNLSLFASLLLTGQLVNPYLFNKTLLGFFVFCFLSSSSYLINDLIDADSDRLHPVKKNRPIASGQLSPATALITAFVLFLSALFLASFINSTFLLLSLFFALLQVSYSLFLKKKAILDIIGISVFFIIRVYAGEITTGFHLPIWILLSVIFLSLFIASGKRRSELFSTGTVARSSLRQYGKGLLNFYTTIFAVCTLITYAMFTFFEEPVRFQGITHSFLLEYFPAALDRKIYMITLAPVIFGIMRYGQIIFEMQEGERPEKIIATDIPLLFSVMLWGLSIVAIIYVF